MFDGGNGSVPPTLAVDVKALHAKLGELTLENDFRICAHQGGIAERVALKARLWHDTMIDRDHALSVTKQAEAVGISRSTVYYVARDVTPEDLAPDEADRPAAHGVPLRGRADVATPAGCQGVRQAHAELCAEVGDGVED